MSFVLNLWEIKRIEQKQSKLFAVNDGLLQIKPTKTSLHISLKMFRNFLYISNLQKYLNKNTF